MAFSFELDPRGYIKKRESFDLEYKQNFQKGDALLKYIKTLVGMANNKGGQIVFGIKDSPHIPLGMTNNKFYEIDPKDIDSKIREYFSPELKWHLATQDYDGRRFGMISVEEADEKPVLCKKNKEEILKEGAIYYRYRAETKEIEYPELNRMLENEKKKERLLWMQHISRISLVGPRNIHLLDRYSGELVKGDKKILIDKELLDQINFIKEGSFTEKEGEGVPTLKLIGTIEGLTDVDNAIIDPNIAYPYTTKELQKELGLSSLHEMCAIIYTLCLKSKPKRHTEIKQGANSNSIHKYSKSTVNAIRSLMDKEGREAFLSRCKDAYNKSRLKNTK